MEPFKSRIEHDCWIFNSLERYVDEKKNPAKINHHNKLCSLFSRNSYSITRFTLLVPSNVNLFSRIAWCKLRERNAILEKELCKSRKRYAFGGNRLCKLRERINNQSERMPSPRNQTVQFV